MSGHDNLDSGHDQQWSSVDGPKPNQPWTETSWLDFVNSPSDDAEKFDFMDTDHDNTLTSVPVQEGPTLDDQTLNGAGSVNDNVNELQFSDLPMFESPHDQTFSAEEISQMPPVNANQANGQGIHTALPDQTFNANPMSNTSPAHYDYNSYNAQGLNNNLTCGPTGADWQHQYPSTHSPGQYPVPPQQQWPGLHRTLFQQNGYAMAGAGAIDPRNSFQLYATGNHDSLDASHGLEHMTAFPVLRKLAPKPASGVMATAPMTQVSKDNAKPMPPPVAHKKREAKAKETKVEEPKVKETAQRKKPTTSNARKVANRRPLHSDTLLVPSLSAAKQLAIKRIALEVVVDDRADVKAHPGVWIPKIAQALEADFRTEPEDHEKFTEDALKEFTRWQTEHENKTWVILEGHQDIPAFAQSCAWILYDEALEAHAIGLEDAGKAISNNSADLKMKCSERLNAAITAIEVYSIVKYDFVRQGRLMALLASPKGFCRRKTENCLVNYKKKPDSGPVRKSEVGEKVSTPAPKPKSQGKKKRNEPSPAVSDDADDEVDGQSDGEFVERAKRTRRTRRN
jgi:hypothetical protein